MKFLKSPTALAALLLSCTLTTASFARAAELPAPAEKATAEAGAATPPRPQLTEGNLNVLARMGAFHEAMRRARSYRGHMVLRKTNHVDGKLTLTKIVDWKSSWTSQGGGLVQSGVGEGSFTTIQGEGGPTTVEKLIQADHNGKRIYFDPVKNVWSEDKEPDDTPDLGAILGFGMWPMLLLSFSMGDEYTVGTPDTNGLVSATNSSNRIRLVFEEASGLLRATVMDSANGEVTELQWKTLELNPTLTQQETQWTPPPTARQVPREENKRSFDF